MFGMGFMEIFLIAIIAIIALGPEKLPTAMVEVAKFIKKFKSGVEDAKSTLDNELNISEMKNEANKFKAQLEDVKSSVNEHSKVDLGLDEIMKDEKEATTTSVENSKDDKIVDEKVSFKKKKKSDKFKVNLDKKDEKSDA